MEMFSPWRTWKPACRTICLNLYSRALRSALDLDFNGHGGFSLLCYFSKQPFHTNINHQEGVHLTKSDDPCTIPLVAVDVPPGCEAVVSRDET